MSNTVSFDPETFKPLFDRFSALCELGHETQFLTLRVMSGSSHERLQVVVDVLADQAVTLGLDRAGFARLLRNQLAAGAKMERPTGELDEYLNAEISAAREAVGKLAGGHDKAIAFLQGIVRSTSLVEGADCEAYAYLKGSVQQADVERVALQWRAEWQETRERREADPLGSEVFWTSRKSQEMPDLIAHFRFYETFALGEFHLVFRDALSHVGEGLLEHANALGPFDVHPAGGWDLRAAGFHLWLASRVRTFRYELQDTVLLALRGLVRRQNPDGWWPSAVSMSAAPPQRPPWPAFLPDAYATALVCVVLLKLASAEEHVQAARRGVLWLLKQQNPDGSWADNVSAPDEKKGHLLTTVLAMEAILRTKDSSTKSATDRAAAWIYGEQGDLGGWFLQQFQSPLVTVLVLEALDLREAAQVLLNSYLESARMFLIRARRLVSDGLEASAPLAIVSAHHGVEAFLYGILTLRQINQSIWDKQSKTIGARAALRRLEEKLKADGRLDRNRIIDGRNDLDRLFDFRDQIVHKAIRVSEADARSAVTAAIEFVRNQSLKELGVDLVEAA